MSMSTILFVRTTVVAISVCAAAAPVAAVAATLSANPASVATVLLRAKPGDTVVLAPGEYPAARFHGKSFEPRISIEAGAAIITRWKFDGWAGLTIKGGTWRNGCEATLPCFSKALSFVRGHKITLQGLKLQGPREAFPDRQDIVPTAYGVEFVDSTEFVITNSQFAGFRTGLLIGQSSDFKVIGNTFTRMSSDGMNAAMSRRGLIEGNTCTDFKILDREHPDCVQIWSRPKAPPTSDLIIRRNTSRGAMQGFSGFNHTRKGVNDGGFDRITIEDNDVESTYVHGVSLTEARDSVVKNNRIKSLPGSRWIANVILRDSPFSVRCGNVVGPFGAKPGFKDPPCKR